MSIFKEMKEMEEKTRLKIVNDPWTLGANVMNIDTKRCVFSGDNITCQLFLLRAYEAS